MIDRKVLGYFSMIFIVLFCYALYMAGEFVILGIVGIVYLGFVFGFDKIKISKRGIEIEDRNK